MQIESRLSDVLSEFARTLATDFPIQGILDHLVKRIVDVLPISAAGVTLISPTTEPRFVAASDESAMRFERLQTDVGEGPCLAVYRTGAAIAIPDLRKDLQFPRFASEARDQGLVAVFTFPLRDRDRRLGALDLYRTTAGALDERDMAAAQTLADVTTAYLLNAQSRADLQVASELARQSSLHDGLTGLPNRTLLLQRLEHAAARSRRSGRLVGVLYIDLDRFKHINDSLGHPAGDQLLIAVAGRIAPLLRSGDTLARMAGDEFVVLCEDLEDAAQAEQVATRIDHAMGSPFQLSQTAVTVSASIGVASAGTDDDAAAGPRVPRQSMGERTGEHARLAQRLLSEADTAMYQVKRAGGGGHGLVDTHRLRAAHQRLSLSKDLRQALAGRELRVAHQPILSTPGSRPIGSEALVRWSHLSRGDVPPVLFIPLAEEAGLIEDIGSYVLDRACRDRFSWPRPDGEALGVSVNVSPLQLMAGDLVHTVANVLTATGTPPELLTLEMTESALIQDQARALSVLEDLKGLGVMLALDDFGTGSSSLSHLRDYPVDIVKIDQTFVADLTTPSTSRHIVEAVVTLAHRLGMRVVAEGVETQQQHEAVLRLGCDYYQGYLSSPAVTTEAFHDLVGRSLDRPRDPAVRRSVEPLRDQQRAEEQPAEAE